MAEYFPVASRWRLGTKKGFRQKAETPVFSMVELGGFEPPTSSMPRQSKYNSLELRYTPQAAQGIANRAFRKIDFSFFSKNGTMWYVFVGVL